MIRILHVMTAMNRAGAETMIMNLYRAVDRSNIQFDFAVSTTEHCDYDDEILALGGRIIRYPKYTGFNHFEYKKWWNDFFTRESEYKIVHGHIGSTASIYLKIAKKHGCYALAHCHSVGEIKSLKDVLYKVFSFSTRYIADYFIACSMKALKSRYGNKISNNKDIYTIIKNSIDVEQYRYSPDVSLQVRHELGIEDHTLVVGTVGRFTVAKNVFFIVDIVKKLKEQEKDFVFLWAGNGELKEPLEKYISENGLVDDIKLLGVRNDIPRLLQAFNVFILPSRFEGLPVVGVEVQAAGVPMLCSENVTQELKVTDCVSFLPINDAQIWVDSILEEKEFRRVDGASDDVIEAGYDVMSESKRLVALYKKALSDRIGEAK